MTCAAARRPRRWYPRAVEPEPFESAEATVVTRNRALAWLAASPLLLTLPSIVLAAAVSPRFVGVTILSVILGTLLSGLNFLVSPLPRRDRSGVTADAGGLSTRRGQRFPREELAEGLVQPERHGRARVLVSRKGARLPFAVEVPDVPTGERLLRALGLDAAHSVASFFGMSRVYASRGGFFGNMALLILGPLGLALVATRLHLPIFGVLALLVGVFSYVSFFMPMRLRIGGDGVIVSWYGRKRFLSYADIAGAEAYDRPFGTTRISGVSLRTTAGEEIRVPLSYGPWTAERPALAAERIRQAREAYARGEHADAAALDRGERSIADWLVALRRVGSGANADARTAPLDPEALFRVVENAAARASLRAAAAVALAQRLDGSGRARLRAVAEGTTAPRLRVALDAASRADEDDAALGEALEALEAEERAARRV